MMEKKLIRRCTGPTAYFRGAAWRWAISAIAGIALVFCSSRAAAQEIEPTEYQLKAAFLFDFAKFVDWPRNSFAGPGAPFSICILGVDPFGAVIDQALRGQSVSGHAVILQRVRDGTQLRQCQVAFISASEKERLPEIFQAARGASVLLVGETPGFAAAGGTIQFQIQDKQVRFSINPDAAKRAGLHVSSKLLALATIVHDANGNEKGSGT